MSSFGDLVKKLRKERAMTLEQVARKIGSHKGYVSGIENGKVNPPSIKFIRKFARLFSYDEREMVRMATVDKAPALVRDEFRSALGGAPAAEGFPLLNTLDTGYATDLLPDGRPRPLSSVTLRLPPLRVDVQYAATVCDGSMETDEGASLSKGDIALLGAAKKLVSGGVFYVIYRLKGSRRAVIRQAHLESNDRVSLQALNKEFESDVVTHDDIDAYFRVVGCIAVCEGTAVNSAV